MKEEIKKDTTLQRRKSESSSARITNSSKDIFICPLFAQNVMVSVLRERKQKMIFHMFEADSCKKKVILKKKKIL